MKQLTITVAMLCALATGACKKAAKAAEVPEPIRAAVAATDRTDADRALDAGRHPAEVLAFFRIAPGQQVAEIFAGGGYTTELLARVVGDGGAVYAHNTTEILDKFARKPWMERAAGPAMKPVVAVERPLDAPLPEDAKGLDAVISFLVYHDAVWLKADRARMNQAIFDALAPGGVYGIVDHSAAEGSGARDAETLHRIDVEVVKQGAPAAWRWDPGIRTGVDIDSEARCGIRTGVDIDSEARPRLRRRRIVRLRRRVGAVVLGMHHAATARARRHARVRRRRGQYFGAGATSTPA